MGAKPGVRVRFSFRVKDRDKIKDSDGHVKGKDGKGGREGEEGEGEESEEGEKG